MTAATLSREKTYTLEDVAELATVPMTTIYEAVRCGRLPVEVSGTRAQPQLIVTADGLNDYLTLKQHRPGTPREETLRLEDIRAGATYYSLREATRRFTVNHRTLCEHAAKGLLEHINIPLGDDVFRLTTDAWMRTYMEQYHQDVPEEYITAREAADRLVLSAQRVYQLMVNGRLEWRYINHKKYILAASVDRYLTLPTNRAGRHRVSSKAQ